MRAPFIPSAISGVLRATPKTKPIAMKLAINEDPPYDIKGKVTPITGSNDVTEAMFTLTCTKNQHATPAVAYLENEALVFSDTRKIE